MQCGEILQSRSVATFLLTHQPSDLYLRKAKAGRRIARLVDSPNLPDGECVYQVTQEGLRD